jgi:DNA excision repair protein ERCC-2
MLNEAIPGNIRKAEHFVAFLKRFIEYMKVRNFRALLMIDTHEGAARCGRDASIFPGASEGDYFHREAAPKVSLACRCPDSRFCAERLTSLVRTLELTNIDEHFALQKVAGFATLVATYEKGERSEATELRPGFLLILEPYETEHATVPNPIFHFT